MALTVDDVFDLRIRDIRARFPKVPLEFSTRVFDDHTELWVYVLDTLQYEEVHRYCRDLENTPLDPPGHPWIFVKAWTGPWPGGDSEAVIRRRRDEFLARQQNQQPATP
jgi:hypothetical protein